MREQDNHEGDRLLWESEVLGIRALHRPRQYSYRGDGYFECQEDVRFDLSRLKTAEPGGEAEQKKPKPVRGQNEQAVLRRLAGAIRESGMSYEDLHTATGISASRIQGYVSKSSSLPGIKATIRLCAALGISADWLFGLKK